MLQYQYMIYIEGLMHKKVKWYLAALAILIITLAAAWAISAKAVAYSSFGGLITKVTPCIPDPEATTCFGSCPFCTTLTGSSCSFYQEITFRPARGSSYSFICPAKSYRFIGGVPRPGAWILGNGPRIFPFQVGISP